MSNAIKIAAIVAVVAAGGAAAWYHRNLRKAANKATDASVLADVLAATAAKGSTAPKVDNVKLFHDLMKKHEIPVCNEIEVSGTDYLDRPVPNQTFTGVDRHGRAFINLYVKLDGSDEVLKRYGRIHDTYSWGTTFVVFQRYTDNQNKFVVGGLRFPLMRDIMGADSKDLTNLTRILNGETVRFYEHTYTDGVDVRDDAVWIDVSMQPL